MSRKKIILIALLLVGLLVFVACGDDTTDDTDPNGDINGEDLGDENGEDDDNGVIDDDDDEDDDNGIIGDDDDEDGMYADGTFTGTADGYGGEIEVEVTIEDDEITDIEVVSHDETEGIGDDAMDELKDRVIEEQGTENVDAISGATVTSDAFLEAVDDALDQAADEAND